MQRRELPFEPDYLTDEIDPSVVAGSPEWSAEIARLMKLREPKLAEVRAYADRTRRDEPDRRFRPSSRDRSEAPGRPE